MMNSGYNNSNDLGRQRTMPPKVIQSTLDATMLRCPMPLLKTKMVLKTLSPGDILLVLATDTGAKKDIPRFIARSQHRLILSTQEDSVYQFYIQVGS